MVFPILGYFLHADHWLNVFTIENILIFRSLLNSTSAVQQKKLQMKHLPTPPPPVSPALRSNSQYNLLGEWIMFVSHCFLNCTPAPCAIKPKQSNCQRLLHLRGAPAGRREPHSTADNGAVPNACLALKKAAYGTLQTGYQARSALPLLNHSCNFHSYRML